MTDTQILTLAISIVIPLSMLLYSNSRVSDVNKRIDDLDRKLTARFDEFQKHLEDKIDNAFAHVELLLKLHEAEHHKNS